MRLGILLFASVLPVILLGKYIYNKDSEKEPKKLLVKLFLGGVGSILLTLGLTLLLAFFYPQILDEEVNLNLIELLFHVFLGVALIEELSKWVFVYKIGFNNPEYDQVFDMIVYGVFVALGFACFENILYVYDGGFTTAIARALLAVPGHACDGVLMGFYLSLAKLAALRGDEKMRKQNLYMSILIPTVTHGIYDYCLFSGVGILIIGFFIYIVSLYSYVIKKIKMVSQYNYKFKFKNNYCVRCGDRVYSEYCTRCGNRNE